MNCQVLAWRKDWIDLSLEDWMTLVRTGQHEDWIGLATEILGLDWMGFYIEQFFQNPPVVEKPGSHIMTDQFLLLISLWMTPQFYLWMTRQSGQCG